MSVYGASDVVRDAAPEDETIRCCSWVKSGGMRDYRNKDDVYFESGSK